MTTTWQHGELLTGTSMKWHDGEGWINLQGMNAVAEMNELGRKGWQAVGMAQVNGGMRYLFKREVREQVHMSPPPNRPM